MSKEYRLTTVKRSLLTVLTPALQSDVRDENLGTESMPAILSI